MIDIDHLRNHDLTGSMAADEIIRLRTALERIVARQFDIDIVPIHKISSRFKELVQIARESLKD